MTEIKIFPLKMDPNTHAQYKLRSLKTGLSMTKLMNRVLAEAMSTMGDKPANLNDVIEEMEAHAEQIYGLQAKLSPLKLKKRGIVGTINLMKRDNGDWMVLFYKEKDLTAINKEIASIEAELKPLKRGVRGTPARGEAKTDLMALEMDKLLGTTLKSQDKLHKPKYASSKDDGFENVAVKLQESLTSAEKFLADMG